MTVTSITAKRPSAYALKAVGAMPTLPMWPPIAARYEIAFPVAAQLTIGGPFLQMATVYLPAVIWHDEAYEPNEGWRAMVNGYECDVTLLWPEKCGRQISELTYNEMIREGSK